jgi:hypothetical protein
VTELEKDLVNWTLLLLGGILGRNKLRKIVHKTPSTDIGQILRTIKPYFLAEKSEQRKNKKTNFDLKAK